MPSNNRTKNIFEAIPNTKSGLDPKGKQEYSHIPRARNITLLCHANRRITNKNHSH